jgi:hypothetical protein
MSEIALRGGEKAGSLPWLANWRRLKLGHAKLPRRTERLEDDKVPGLRLGTHRL